MRYTERDREVMARTVEQVHRKFDALARRYGVGPPDLEGLLEGLAPRSNIGGLLRSLTPAPAAEAPVLAGFIDSLTVESQGTDWFLKHVSQFNEPRLLEEEPEFLRSVEMMDVSDPGQPATPRKIWLNRKLYRALRRSAGG